jgi:hypothetical protein
MRISCPGFARILDEEGRYALLLNRKRSEKGRRVFSPIGGALQLNTPEDMHYLIETFGARNFENGLDLRFQVPDDQADAIKKWFHSDLGRRMREASVAREVREELVDEDEILTMKDLESFHETFSHFCYFSALKEDPERGKHTFTTYIVEVYDFTVPVAVIAEMKKYSAVYFAHENEITSKDPRIGKNGEIGNITKTILRNR